MLKSTLLLTTLLLIIGCTGRSVDEPLPCPTAATVRDLTGLDGCDFVFELEDGTRLIPLRIGFCGTPPVPEEVSKDVLANFNFIDGREVMIDYVEEPDVATTCMAGKVVTITRLCEKDFPAED